MSKVQKTESKLVRKDIVRVGRPDELDYPLDNHIGAATDVTRDATYDHADQQAQHYAAQSD